MFLAGLTAVRAGSQRLRTGSAVGGALKSLECERKYSSTDLGGGGGRLDLGKHIGALVPLNILHGEVCWVVWCCGETPGRSRLVCGED